MKLTPALALSAIVLAVPAFSLASAPDQASTAHHDTEFLKKANQGSVDEVDLAKFVLGKTTDPDVKAFAQRMIDDHSKLLNDMKPFDSEAGLSIPDHVDVETKAEEAKLELLSGKSFDKSYIKSMVKDHHKDFEDFSQEAATTGYPAFKAVVEKGKDTIKEHLEMIDGLAKKNGLAPAPVAKM
jgi:putative membrane protein